MSLLSNSFSLIGTATPLTIASPTEAASPLSPLTATNIALHQMPGVAKAVDTTLNVILSSGTLLVALALGLLLRRTCIRRLEKTILDKWAVQTLGILVIIPPLLAGVIIALSIWNNLFSLIADLKASYDIDIYAIGLNFAETLILIALSIGFARTAKTLTIRGLGERRLNPNTQTLLARIVYITVLTIASFCVLSIWQMPVGVPVAAIGVITVVTTVAFQDILKDLVAGFYLLLSRPFLIHDQIRISIAATLYIGQVQNIELRTTRLRLISGEEVSIPNALVFSSTVINTSYFEDRRATIAVTIPVADFVPHETAHQIGKTLRNLETIRQKPEPMVLFTSLTEGKITLLAHFWVASSRTRDISDAMYVLYTLLPNAEVAVHEPVDMV